MLTGRIFYEATAPPGCGLFNIELSGERVVKLHPRHRLCDPLYDLLADFFPSTESTCPRCSQFIVCVSHMLDFIANLVGGKTTGCRQDVRGMVR